MSDGWGRAAEAGGEFIQPRQLAGHLLIIFPIGYVPHIQTRFSQQGKQSDAVAVDVVDLDDKNEQGVPGRIYRNSNWMQGQIIASLRPSIGNKVLATIGQGVSKSGMNPPWVIIDMFDDPTAMERASAWLAANPGFHPSPFVIRQPAPPVQQQAPAQPSYPQQQPHLPVQPTYQQPQQQFGGYQEPQQQFGGYPQQPQEQFGGYPQNPGPSYQQPVQQPQQQPRTYPVPGAPQVPQQDQTILSQMREQYRQQQAVNDQDPPF